MGNDKVLRQAVRVSPASMNRVDVIRYLLSGRRHTSYLEIGVRRGDCFREIRAGCKVAVDPHFQIAKRHYWHWRNVISARYFECTSDAFFAEKLGQCRVAPFDVIFIDGLHTYQQSFADVENSLRHLKPDGWIVLHDCNPPCEMAAVPATSYAEAKAKFGLRESGGAWNGDVWKTVVRLRSQACDLDITVLDCDEGLGLIRRGTTGELLSFTADQIQTLSYADLACDRKRLLNLRPPETLLVPRPSQVVE